MDLSIWNIINVFGALGLFIYGLKVMSEGIQRAAGKHLRAFLNRMTSSKLTGLISGFFITSIIQSSSASTVLTVGFVNAGLITVTQSMGVIFGINIGTTITSWIVSILGISLNSYKTVLPLLILIVPLLLHKNKKFNAWGDFLVGFVLLIIGIYFMRDNIPNISSFGESLTFVESMSKYGFFSKIIFVLFGLLFTILLQSSTATIALTIVFCNNGWLTFDVAAAMVLGANIGTTSTAEIAALIGNRSAKLVARIHSLFNIFGVLWMLPIIGFILKTVDWLGLHLFYASSAFEDNTSVPLALSIFHTLFNVLNAGIFFLIPGFLLRMASKSIRKKDAPPEADTYTPFEDSLNLPELTIIGAQREVAKFAGVTKKMNAYITQLFSEPEFEKKSIIHEKMTLHELNINAFQSSLSKYLNKSLSEEVSVSTTSKINSLNQICIHLENTGNLYLKMADTLKIKNTQKIWFNQQQRSLINRIFFLLLQQHKLIQENLFSSKNQIFSEERSEVHSREIDLKISLESKEVEHNQEVNKASLLYFEQLLENCQTINIDNSKIIKLIDSLLSD